MTRLGRAEVFSTLNGHLKFGTLPDGSYFTEIGNCKGEPRLALQEAMAAAKLINQSAAGKKISLFMSGGIDSEAMLQSFLDAEVKITVVFIRFEKEYNWHDIKSNVDVCETLGVPFEFFDIDVLQFIEQRDFLKYVKKFQASSLSDAIKLSVLDRYSEEFCVFSGKPMIPQFNGPEEFVFGLPNYQNSSVSRYFKAKNRQGVAHFFLFTPELGFSFARTPIVQEFIMMGEKGASVSASYQIKCVAYQEGGFRVRPRRCKLSGLETISEVFPGTYQLCESEIKEKVNLPLMQREVVKTDYLRVDSIRREFRWLL